MADLIPNIKHVYLNHKEKKELDFIIARGNLIVEDLARQNGMIFKKRDIYRLVILRNLRTHSKCSDIEIENCHKLSTEDVDKIKEIETIKTRMLEVYLPLVMKVAKKASENFHPGKIEDFVSEAYTQFLHVMWRFNRYDVCFSTLVTFSMKRQMINTIRDMNRRKRSETLTDDDIPKVNDLISFEAVVKDLSGRLTATEVNTIKNFLDCGSVKNIAKKEGILLGTAMRHFKKAKKSLAGYFFDDTY